MQTTPAIILAGGMGTRLSKVVNDVPKPMADINHQPFLHYLFQYLSTQNIHSVILSIGYLHEKITNYFGNKYFDIDIEYSIENEPLGTGGAIRKAYELVKKDAFVLNGDTFFGIDLQKLKHPTNDIQVALKQMKNFDRYGTVEMNDNDIITAFNEKKSCKEGLINGGIYYLRENIFKHLEHNLKFSFEKEILENRASSLTIGAKVFEDYFIDIGIPEDYYKAVTYFQMHKFEK